jgi:DNA sulfur modification protein DndB
MAMVIPAIKGKMGSTDFFEAKMPARELVHGVRPARDLDEWASMSIDERLQREPDKKRIQTEIAPYIARDPDRFFGSVLVLVYKGEVHFESIKELGSKVPAAYRSVAADIGFLTIDGGALVVLDGQHRLLALQHVIQGDVDGPERDKVPSDDVNVIFIKHEENRKTRKIFNKVNRYAKKTSRGDDIITSEDDGYAIVARMLLADGAPLSVQYMDPKTKQPEDIVNWRSNTLSARSWKLTTISAVFDSVKMILTAQGIPKLDPSLRPSEIDLQDYYDRVEQFWKTVLAGIEPFAAALEDAESIPERREDEAPYSLLFKPAGQMALIEGLLIATKDGRMKLKTAVERANLVPWSMTEGIWEGVIIRPNGTIDWRTEARRHAAQLIAYMIAADVMPEAEIERIKTDYNLQLGYDFEDPDPDEEPHELPEPVAGVTSSRK